ncbi:MAG: HAD family hydrolase [Clostridiales bacterium]|nr:HAD family hydrolase [Clostridiales bacterium]
MKLPEMIIFDYGDTLMREKNVDVQSAAQALYSHIRLNPDALDEEEVCSAFVELYLKAQSAVKGSGTDVHVADVARLAFAGTGIELDIGYDECELLVWNSAVKGEILPGAGAVLKLLNEKGIRSAVISNISFSGESMRRRLNEYLPENRFEFIIASCDYVFKKPELLLFEAALKKSGLSAESVWFCGDSFNADVKGASAAGIYPVWYNSGNRKPPDDAEKYNYCEIRSFAELEKILRGDGENA